MLVDNDTFLQKLSELFEKTTSSVWLTHKRLSRDGDDTIAEEDREYPCLLRALIGNPAKEVYSTHVTSSNLQKFHSTYGSLLKATMTPLLRKRDKKREKQRAEEYAKRKKTMTEAVVIEGPKRGKGRRARQRRVKAAIKQQEAKERAEKRNEAKKVKS